MIGQGDILYQIDNGPMREEVYDRATWRRISSNKKVGSG